MRRAHILTAAAIMAMPAMAQDVAAMEALRLRFGQAATRATAYFRSADSVGQSLKARGNTLHPSLITLRLRIESTLDETEAALNKGEIESASQSMGRVEGLIDKFAQKVGGD